MVSVTSLFIIAASCIQLTYSIVSLKDISELIRLFGNPRYPRSERVSINIIHVPEECRNKTYCTIMPKNYPQERFNKLFENKTVIPQPSLHAVDAILTNRVGGLEDDYDACETEIDNKPLSMVRDPKTNKWRLVVQAPEQDYRQHIYLALCKNKYAKCQLNELLPYNVTSYCKQSYITVRLLVAKGLSDTELINVTLPACCSCSCKIK